MITAAATQRASSGWGQQTQIDQMAQGFQAINVLTNQCKPFKHVINLTQERFKEDELKLLNKNLNEEQETLVNIIRIRATPKICGK